jgi:formylglycine-generating enzyme required for sulfatase activity
MPHAVPILFFALLATTTETVPLTIQSHDSAGAPVVAEVMVDGAVVGNTWSEISLGVGSHLVIVGDAARQWSSQVTLLAGEAQTMTVTLHATIPMVLIAPGTFRAGSPPDEQGRQDDETQHPVTLTRPFWVATTEVNQALFAAVTGTNPSRWPDPDRPVENVTWFDCIQFCNQLSEQHGLQPAYVVTDQKSVEWDRAADGYRLPTEAEWEYASRAGTSSIYCFGDDPARLYLYANYCDMSCSHTWRDTEHSDGFINTAPVASFEPNAWGLYDMHGNVWEWCWDWYVPFGEERLVDPSGPLEGRFKAERGGCWQVGPEMCRQAYRYYAGPDEKRTYLGMRVVRSQN